MGFSYRAKQRHRKKGDDQTRDQTRQDAPKDEDQRDFGIVTDDQPIEDFDPRVGQGHRDRGEETHKSENHGMQIDVVLFLAEGQIEKADDDRPERRRPKPQGSGWPNAVTRGHLDYHFAQKGDDEPVREAKIAGRENDGNRSE